MTTKLDEMWAALEAHKPKRGYAKAWRVMLKKRTYEAARAAYWAAPEGSAAEAAARAASAVEGAAEARAFMVWADRHAQEAIDALREVKP